MTVLTAFAPGIPAALAALPPVPTHSGPVTARAGPLAVPALGPGAATLTLSPATGGLNANVEANGSGFGANSTVSISLDGSAVPASCYGNATGVLVSPTGGVCSFTVPNSSAAGPGAVEAIGWSNSNASPVGNYPSGIVFDTGQSEAFVANEVSDTVSVLSATNGSTLVTVSGTPGADACAYDPAQGEVFVADGTNATVGVINDTSDTLVANITVGADPDALAYDPAKSELFVADGGASNVTIVDVLNDSVVANVTTGLDPDALAYDSGQGEVFVGNWWPGTVSVINDTNDTVVANFYSAPGNIGSPTGIAYASQLGELFVSNSFGSNVTVISDRTDAILASVAVGWNPYGVAYDPVLGDVFTPNWGPNNVTVINATNDTVVATLPVGISPSAVAYDPATGGVYVANQWTANVTPITDVAQGSAAFTVEPSLLLDPDSGSPGTVVAVVGVGLASNSTISLGFAGASVSTTCATDGTGRFPGRSGTPCDFTVPASPAGSTLVTASDGSSSVNASYQMTPALNLSGSSGPVGGAVSATGVGFAASHAISFGIAGATVASNCSTDATGSFPGTSGTSCSFTVPAAPYGDDRISASDGTHVQNATYFVTSELTLSAANGSVGSDLNVSGVGFDPNSSIAITVGGRTVTSTCATDASGQFPGTAGTGCQVTVPAEPGGPQTVAASDGRFVETGVFLVDESVALSGTRGPVGSTVTATVLGGAPNATLDLTMGGVALPPTCTSDVNGTYPSATSNACSFQVPALPAGAEPLVSLGTLTSSNISVNLGGDPSAVAVDPVREQLFVTGVQYAAVTVVSIPDDSVIASIPVGPGAGALAYDPMTDQVFVAISGGLASNVSVIDAANDTVVANVTVASAPNALAYDAGRQEVYCAGWSNVSVISAVTDRVVATVPAGYNPYALAYDAALGEVFVGNIYSNNITVLNDTTNAVVGNFSLGSGPTALAYDSGTGELFAAQDGTAWVSVLDATNGTVVTNVTVGYGVNALAYAPGSGEVLASVYGPGQVAAIADANDSVLGWVSTGPGFSGTPLSVAVDPDNGLAYVANGGFGNVTVLGDVTAVLAFNVSASVSLAQRSADVGETITVSGSGYVGAGSIRSLVIGGMAVACQRATLGSCAGGNLTTAADGSFVAMVVVPAGLSAGSYNLTVTDHAGDSASIGLTVDLAPVVGSIEMNRTQVDVGQTVTLAAPVSAGSGGYRYLWSGLPAGCSSASRATVNCTVTTPGNHTITVQVTDSNGVSATSPPAYLTIYPTPAAARPLASPGSGAADAGQTVTFTESATAGTGTFIAYAWTGLPSGCTGSANASVTCAGPGLTAASYEIAVSVTDSDNATSPASPILYYAVDPDPAVTAPDPSRPSADLGQSVTFSVTASEGSGGYGYTWTGLPAGCAAASAPSITCVPTTTGGYNLSVEVDDSNQGAATSPVVSFQVFADPAVGLSGNRTVLDVGESVSLAAVTSGGAGTYTELWSGLPGGCAGTGAARTCVPDRPGNYSVRVTVTDSNGETAISPLLAIVVAPALTAAPTDSVGTATPGESVTFSAAASGGTGPWTYAWDFGDGAFGAGASVVHSYPAAGTYQVSLWVNDSTGASVRAVLNLTVRSPSTPAPLSAGEIAVVAGLSLAAALGIVRTLRRRRPGRELPAEAPDEVPDPDSEVDGDVLAAEPGPTGPVITRP